jgi:hypothetical protein
LRTLRSRADDLRYLEQAPDDAPLQISHLSRGLQRLAHETRALRSSLDEPARQLASVSGRMSPDFDPGSLDRTLLNTSREIGDLLETVRRLDDADRAHLVDVGASPDAVRDTFAAEGFALELGRGGPARARQLRLRIDQLRRALEHLERALQIQPDPYR